MKSNWLEIKAVIASLCFFIINFYLENQVKDNVYYVLILMELL